MREEFGSGISETAARAENPPSEWQAKQRLAGTKLFECMSSKAAYDIATRAICATEWRKEVLSDAWKVQVLKRADAFHVCEKPGGDLDTAKVGDLHNREACKRRSSGHQQSPKPHRPPGKRSRSIIHTPKDMVQPERGRGSELVREREQKVNHKYRVDLVTNVTCDM